jgi:hypothetical protein
LEANRKEGRQINFRVNEEEYERIKKMADSLGMSVSAFCKSKAKGSRIKSPKIDRQGAIEIASELRRIGVNVNQIAKNLNSGLSTSEGQINALQEELGEIWRLLNLAVQK